MLHCSNKRSYHRSSSSLCLSATSRIQSYFSRFISQYWTIFDTHKIRLLSYNWFKSNFTFNFMWNSIEIWEKQCFNYFMIYLFRICNIIKIILFNIKRFKRIENKISKKEIILWKIQSWGTSMGVQSVENIKHNTEDKEILYNMQKYINYTWRR